MPTPYEHLEQSAFFSWIETQLAMYPQLMLMFAVPNGAGVRHMRNSKGQRFSPEASKLRAEGMRKGIPDIFLSLPSGPYAGLWIEFKHGDNKPSKEQWVYLKCFALLGYSTHICYDWLSASRVTLGYLNLNSSTAIYKSVVTIHKDEQEQVLEVKEKFHELLGELRK